MKIWIIDTETTGLPYQPGYGRYYPYSKLKFYDSSRLVQLGILEFELVEGKYVQTAVYDYIHKGDFKINNSEFHGISNEIMVNNGLPINEIISKIEKKFNNVSLIVAHNIKFDISIIASELYRAGLTTQLKDFLKIPTFCTSIGTRNIVKIKGKNYRGGYKQPKLIELYEWIFNKKPEEEDDMHNAITDCKVLEKCFFALVNKGYYKIKNRK
jgi:DNA polymerase III epsilon subunit-like protein